MGLERAVVSVVRVGDALRVGLARFRRIALASSSYVLDARQRWLWFQMMRLRRSPLSMSSAPWRFVPQVHDNTAHLVAVAEGELSRCRLRRSCRVAAEGEASAATSSREVAIETGVKCDVAVVGVHIQTRILVRFVPHYE